MKIQLLYFPECPNAEAARAALQDALQSLRIEYAVEEVDVTAPTTPDALRSWSSPTILINDMDIAGEPQPSGSSCRLYVDGKGQRSGVPPVVLIKNALRNAVDGGVGHA